jgi:hypothetical protein
MQLLIFVLSVLSVGSVLFPVRSDRPSAQADDDLRAGFL